ncbi:hypothetical protein ASPWEDRAFT_151903 [Aspergillus wentii DTO 134E9]|uniref:Uncharacterized protein n=1 Tax=Aspergillus wentii DTO 134E9 TaxID=1073089 RepID=A0A1L9RNE9_ASPWE|nr:uncharacterized protein ASPWEDRAFT_151903 [Aspergillus wentii DTO 134E9]KAI9934380.1 hypothetical protein MW887_005457 [Aspergillus wentii]OJJ36475.1 hypothetical protein ASPWEDRAFT_151903 [Aspergillus wentii DTO 134E9]
MHLSKILLPLLPITLTLASNPNPNPNPVVPRAPESTGGLLNDLPGIIDGVKDILSQDTIEDLQVIIKGGATLLGGDTPQNLKDLLSKDNLNQLQDIITNAHGLLSAKFVNNTETLIDEATPLVTDVSKLLSAILSTIFE